MSKLAALDQEQQEQYEETLNYLISIKWSSLIWEVHRNYLDDVQWRSLNLLSRGSIRIGYLDGLYEWDC